MGKVAMVGDETSVAGFRPLGLAVFPVEHAEEARDLWDTLASGEYSVVFVTEPVFDAVCDLAAETAGRATPAVTIVPGVGSEGGVGGSRLAAAIERALGTRLPLGEDE